MRVGVMRARNVRAMRVRAMTIVMVRDGSRVIIIVRGGEMGSRVI